MSTHARCGVFGLLVTLAQLLVATTAGAQGDAPQLSEELLSAFQPMVFDGGAAGTLPYRLMQPIGALPTTGEQSTRYPLVVFLHGRGERGADNVRQLTYLDPVATPEFRRRYPAYVVAPQCPEEGEVMWTDRLDPWLPVTMSENPSPPLVKVRALVSQLMERYPIDADRVYLVGLSMGGYATWDLISRYPGEYAAAAPVCGAGDLSKAQEMATTPLWVVHGELDPVVSVGHSRQMVAALCEAGGNPVYSELEGVGHNSWQPAFANRALWDWLFAQRRQGR